MYKTHVKNSIRYYLLIVFALLFLFFSNDFGLTDVQKTAIVMAVGIDREEENFILTSQVAVPQSSKQGQSSETVQLVSRGKTVGEAFEEINAKTGWYPKLVFCNLILLGEKAASENVFDALDYFLRDEYLSDNCYVATCDGLAKDVLDSSALVDPSSSTAIQKVLAPHAERVGTVLPNTLKDFSIGYFSESRSSFLPIVKKEKGQEHIEGSTSEGKDNSGGSSKEGENGASQKDKPVFSGSETALFVGGKRVETLDSEETFALSAVLNPLRLASYSVERNGETCSLTIKRNRPSISLKAREEKQFLLTVEVGMDAGILDLSRSQNLKELKDAGDVPTEYFTMAEKKLAGEIKSVYEKCKRVNCDLFGVRERLIKYERRRFHKHENTAFLSTLIDVKVRFRNIR